MSKQQAQLNALAQVRAQLQTGIDWQQRCELLGLPPVADAQLQLRAFAADWLVDLASLEISRSDGQPVRLGDQILLLHYLRCELPIQRTGTWVTFRQFRGGQFYFGPFSARSTAPLVKRFGNDITPLRNNLDRFDWQPLEQGDLGARIQTFGPLELGMLYYCGDAEVGPQAVALFDACVLRAFGAEDAAYLASRVCLALL